MQNALTIDVEDYFHANALSRVAPRESWGSFEQRAEANTNRLLDLLAAHDVKATCFVLGWVAERYPSLVHRIVSDGHELASHGYWHRLIFSQEPAVFREDIHRSKTLLEDIGGVRVKGYRAPSFSVVERTLWALDVLAEEGYTFDASIFPIRHDTYGIPSAPRHAHRFTRNGTRIFEIPSSTTTVFGANLPVAGGGYFRLLPYAWTHWGIARVNRGEQKPVVFYIHPWDLDPGQPRFTGVSALSRLRHYTHLDECESRLRRMLKDFRWGRVCDVWPEAVV
jgi:polysaccharide deacetylase family protein (PEP-CTERM system associated)